MKNFHAGKCSCASYNFTCARDTFQTFPFRPTNAHVPFVFMLLSTYSGTPVGANYGPAVLK